MSDDRLQIHIASWMKQLEFPSVVELRCAQEIIDDVTVDAESDYAALANDLLESASSDAFSEGKSRNYNLVAIDAQQRRFPCSLRIRRRIDRSAAEVLTVMSKQIVDLHEVIRKERKENAAVQDRLIQRLDDANRRLNDELHKHRERASESIDKLENLRSKDLERKMVIEQHEADNELKERVTNAFIPLALAIGSKMTGGKLPAKNIQAVMLTEIATALTEDQIDNIQGVLAEDWPTMKVILDKTLQGQDCVEEFTSFARKLSPEKTMGVVQCMNIGQQAALQDLLQHASNGH